MKPLTPELLKELSKTKNGFYSWDYVCRLASRVIELQTQLVEKEWIKVTDRLPELFCPVIVSGERDQDFVKEEIAWIYMFFDDGEPNWTCWHVKNVTKWKYYTQPSKEK